MTGFHRDFNGFYWVSHLFYRVLLGFAGLLMRMKVVAISVSSVVFFLWNSSNFPTHLPFSAFFLTIDFHSIESLSSFVLDSSFEVD